MPRDQGETSLTEKAQTGLDHADELEKLIDGSDTWEGVVGRIKWLMDTLSPLAGVRTIFVLSSTNPTPVLSLIRLRRWRIACFQ